MRLGFLVHFAEITPSLNGTQPSAACSLPGSFTAWWDFPTFPTPTDARDHRSKNVYFAITHATVFRQ
jgi:hypothetical protein